MLAELQAVGTNILDIVKVVVPLSVGLLPLMARFSKTKIDAIADPATQSEAFEHDVIHDTADEIIESIDKDIKQAEGEQVISLIDIKTEVLLTLANAHEDMTGKLKKIHDTPD